MKNTRTLLAMLFVALVLTSCVREYKEEPNTRRNGQGQVQNAAQNKQPARTGQNQAARSSSQKSIDSNGNYYMELKSAVGLTKTEMEKVKVVIEKFRPQIKTANKQNKNKAVQLKQKRNSALAAILSSAQMTKKQYFDSVFYGFKPDNPTSPINVKTSLGLTDEQVFNWIEIQSDFKQKKQGKSIDEIADLLGDRNAKLQEVFSADQFSGYLTLMRKTYQKANI